MSNHITISREPLDLLLLAMRRTSAKKDAEAKEVANSDDPIKNFKEGLYSGYRDCAEMYADQLESIIKIYGKSLEGEQT